LAKYQLYTDGALRKGNLGAWAFVIIKDGELLDFKAHQVPDTTNNRMELTPVIEGLKKFDPKTASIEVVSDSAYVVNCFLQKWYRKWIHNGWKGSSGLEVKNRDMWTELLKLTMEFKIPITWTHVKGHSGDKWNEYCDNLCDLLYK